VCLPTPRCASPSSSSSSSSPSSSYPPPNTRVPTQRRERHVYGCDTAPGSNAYSKFSRGRRARATESLVLRPDYSTERGARVRKFGYFISKALTVPPDRPPPLSLSLAPALCLSSLLLPPFARSLGPSPPPCPACLFSVSIVRPRASSSPLPLPPPLRITCVLCLFDVARYAF